LYRLNGGELFDYVIAKEYLDENEASHYMQQILSAMDFCHKKKIVHLDLKVSILPPYSTRCVQTFDLS